MQVEDFSDLKNVPMEKLLKLRDVALDYHAEMEQAQTQAWCRYQEIVKDIEERKNAEKAV
ncbi:hypothetical protein SP40_67 [Salmonella phage 40]|nr:hypothetical protein SP40_67 [Salmonella phage 40]